MNETQTTALQAAGYAWNEDLQCYVHTNDTNCIRATTTEEEFQIGRIEEGTPIWAEGNYSFEEALSQPLMAEESLQEVDAVSGEENLEDRPE